MTNDLIQLQLQCSESWSDMKPTETGAYCGVCSTELVDFSGCSTTEINDYLNQHSGKKICGKFTKNQLHAESPALYQPLVQFSLRSLVLGAALSSFLSFDLRASNEAVLGGGLLSSHSYHPTPTTVITVVEEDRTTVLPFAVVTLLGPTELAIETAVTGMTGEVTLLNLEHDVLYQVRVEHPGYETKTAYISKDTWTEGGKITLSKLLEEKKNTP